MSKLGHAFHRSSFLAVVSAWLCLDMQAASAKALYPTKATCEAAGWTWIAPHSTVTPRTSDPSLVAAGVMGAEGFSRIPLSLPAGWDVTYLNACKANSLGTVWLGGCSPDGMSAALNVLHPGQHWLALTFNSSPLVEQIKAIQLMVDALGYGSPALVPIYGRADHILATGSLCVKFMSDRLTMANFDVSSFHDAVFATDGAGRATFGTNSFSGREFQFNFYEVLSDLCGTPPCPDRFYDQYMVMYDPPVGAPFLTSPTPVHKDVMFDRPSGIVPKGEMTAEQATREVKRSLLESGFLADPQVAQRLDQGMALPAYAVTRLGRKGVRTESFIVPIRADRGGVSLFVRLSGEDGAVESLFTPDSPFTYQPVSSQQALTLGLSLVRNGERLGEGHLVWDASLSQPDIRHPHQPFFELPVIDSAGRSTEGIWVAMHTGRVIGRGPLRVPRVRP